MSSSFSQPYVEEMFNLIGGSFLRFDWRGRFLMAFGDRIFAISTQSGDVERGMDKEAFGEFQPVVVGTNPVGDDEGTEPFDV